ncbi:ribbon-helix-helix protein, CopG family [Mesorhizobium sp. M7A.F.Ca.US.010.02.1.1]|uniref:type II toxin-antitoxin system RelB family antitoxin n=1 Tax=Mesorhizobium sp. M7A.F.Ca.US.010.02.1.1 TaxID=2496743 RepID=UPI000FD22BA9|nr:ribbon-helix-helix protein, CopG family [Mesorhizobium sp. M7A.F.Ca.US.010.02.1.1]RUW88315.1 ribbon-helix-helix protein, CopG family [Mesorhizobium sp. M7A.F.Ca.US.010.02.1.1]
MSTSIRLSPEIRLRLDALASKTGRSRAYHMREFIERGLEDVEDYYLAAEVLARIRSGEEGIMKGDDFWGSDVYR